MVLYVTRVEPWLVRRLWRSADKSARMFKCVFIEPVAVRAGAVCCNSHKSTADKSASAARGGAYRLWHDTVHEQPLEIPDMLQINTGFGMNVSRLPAELKHFICWIQQNTISLLLFWVVIFLCLFCRWRWSPKRKCPYWIWMTVSSSSLSNTDCSTFRSPATAFSQLWF